MEDIIEMLHRGGYSCVMKNKEEIRTFNRRGVSDLYELYRTEPAFMRGAFVADKIIGKGAAALMVLGGIARVYTDVISIPALKLLRESGVEVSFEIEVPYIINRSGTGQCPLEAACGDLNVVEIYPVIVNFINQMQADKRS